MNKAWMVDGVMTIGIVALIVSPALAQPAGRQPTRTIDGPPGRSDDQSISINRRPTRQVDAGPSNEQQSDQQAGRIRSSRQVILPGLRRMPPRPSSRWRLGVDTDNAPKGLRITDVSPA